MPRFYAIGHIRRLLSQMQLQKVPFGRILFCLVEIDRHHNLYSRAPWCSR